MRQFGGCLLASIGLLLAGLPGACALFLLPGIFSGRASKENLFGLFLLLGLPILLGIFFIVVGISLANSRDEPEQPPP